MIAPTGIWEAALLEAGRAVHPGRWVGPGFPEWMWSPINVLLARRPGECVLVDCGSGVLAPLWPFDGIEADLPAALAGVGVTPADVDLVVLSHLDDDHVGGLFAGAWPDRLEPVFPAARVTAPEEAVISARSAPAGSPQSVVVATLDRLGVLVTFAGGDEPTPGLRIISAPGHRAGHAAVRLEGHDPLLHLVDTLHHLAHVTDPDWDREADSEPDVALATRRDLLAECARTGIRAVAAHIPGPGCFRIVHAADGRLGYETVDGVLA